MTLVQPACAVQSEVHLAGCGGRRWGEGVRVTRTMARLLGAGGGELIARLGTVFAHGGYADGTKLHRS